MKLTKWISNSPEVLKTIPDDEKAPLQPKDFDFELEDENYVSKPTKVVGMNWDPKEDVFSFEPFKKLETDKVAFTRRGCSSLVPKFHDSMGLVMPFTLRGKIIIQKCWTYTVEDKDKKNEDWIGMKSSHKS